MCKLLKIKILYTKVNFANSVSRLVSLFLITSQINENYTEFGF